MMDWFRSGGFGMIVVLAIGAGSIGYAARALGGPTKERLAILRSLPALIMTVAVGAFGMNMWAVNRHAFDEAFLKQFGGTMADSARIALEGVTESAQPFTLAGLLATVVIVLRMLADAKHAKSEG